VPSVLKDRWAWYVNHLAPANLHPKSRIIAQSSIGFIRLSVRHAAGKPQSPVSGLSKDHNNKRTNSASLLRLLRIDPGLSCR
jgi:hypothetical protein